jgi:hypothetical protein
MLLLGSLARLVSRENALLILATRKSANSGAITLIWNHVEKQFKKPPNEFK